MSVSLSFFAATKDKTKEKYKIRSHAVKGQKYLSETIHYEEIKKGFLNLFCSPVGSGKTHWALNELKRTVSNPYKMVYLIDTINGKEQLLKHPNTAYYSRDWAETVQNGDVWFGEAITGNKVVVMTYAKFGVLAKDYPNFGFSFELILCDEIHNLPRFSSFISHNPNDTPYHKIAKERLEHIVNQGQVKVIGLSATPKRAEQMNCPSQYITIDEDVRQYEVNKTISYTNPKLLLTELSSSEKGIVYIGHVTKMKEFWEEAEKLGFRAIAIWSIQNKDHPMTEEQHNARELILSNSKLPPQYDLVIINSSSETSINIFGTVDYIIIHTQECEAQIQVRGRYRGDLDKLYLLDYNTLPQVPDCFMGRKLFSEDKQDLCDTLCLRNENKRILKWNSIKLKLEEAGYFITEGRQNNKRFAIITK